MTDKLDPIGQTVYKVVFDVRYDNFQSYPGLWTNLPPGTPQTSSGVIHTLAEKMTLVMRPNFTVFGYRWGVKGSPRLNIVNFDSPLNGVYLDGPPKDILSATLSVGGVAFDPNGVYKTVKSRMQFPIGSDILLPKGTKTVPVLNGKIQQIITAYAAVGASDNFGRPLSVYQYATFQINAFYQKKRGY